MFIIRTWPSLAADRAGKSSEKCDSVVFSPKELVDVINILVGTILQCASGVLVL